MITKVTSENKGLYYALFEKASKALGYDTEDECIKSLDEYFACFDDLALMDKVYQVLPLDEPTFDIDGNTRTITIPEVFKKNGISVKGDQAAEIIYFTIDRYFDTIDLYNDGIAVIVQWETASNGKNVTTGISPVLFKDVSVLADQNKMIFGWAINNTITANAGNIKFAVRFYKVENKELVFSLSTLTANAVIQPALDFDFMADSSYVFNANTITDDIQMIQNRHAWQNSSPHLEKTSKDPVFITPLIPADDSTCVEHVYEEDGVTVKFHCMDLDENGVRKFTVSASAEDGGYISYTWYNGENNLGAGEDEYLPCATDEKYDPSLVYYVKEIKGGVESYKVYTQFQAANAGTLITELTEQKLYHKYNTFTATAVGDYKVKVKNRSGIVPALIDSPVVRIPGPAAFEVTMAENAEHALIGEDGTADLAISVTKGNEHDEIVYTWYKNGTEVEGDEATFSTEEYDEETMALVDDTYKVSVIAERNGATTAAVEKSFRVTAPAAEPKAALKYENYTLRPGKSFVLGAIVDIAGILSDEVALTWKKVALTDVEAPEEGDIVNDPANDTVLKTETIKIVDGKLEREPVLLVDATGTIYVEVVNIVNGSESTAAVSGHCVVSQA